MVGVNTSGLTIRALTIVSAFRHLKAHKRARFVWWGGAAATRSAAARLGTLGA